MGWSQLYREASSDGLQGLVLSLVLFNIFINDLDEDPDVRLSNL